MIYNILSLSHLILIITLWSRKCLHLTHGGKEAFRCWGQSHTVNIIWASQLQIWDYFNCIKLIGHRFTKAGSQTSFMVKSIFNAQCEKYPMVVIHLGRMSNRNTRKYFHPSSASYCAASSIYQMSKFPTFLLLLPHGLGSKLPWGFFSVFYVL